MEIRNTFEISVEKPQRKKSLRPRGRNCGNNIKIDLKTIGGKFRIGFV
jgi:hypothetical protein